MKTTKILFWTTTIIIFLFEGVMPALTSQTELAKEGIRHLGYPAYFGMALVVFKVVGTIILILPQVSARIKEWAYAGLFFDLAGAVYSGVAISWAFDPMMLTLLAWIVPGIVSYIYFHKLKAE